MFVMLKAARKDSLKELLCTPMHAYMEIGPTCVITVAALKCSCAPPSVISVLVIVLTVQFELCQCV